MNNEIKDKLSKIYALIDRGATEGEKSSARAALDRLVRKYNVTAEQLDSINKKQYSFKYSTQLELWLLARIQKVMLNEKLTGYRIRGTREVRIELKYESFITIECAYEYFRRNMKAQWKIVCAPELQRCKKDKTRNKRRCELQRAFFTRYVILSGLYNEGEVEELDVNKMTVQEMKNLYAMRGIEGGKYNRQITNGYYLE